MNEEQLRDIFNATNTAEPLSEGWPGLLRYGMAVAAAEREACAKVCERIGGKMTDDCDGAQPGFWPDQVAHRCETEIMMRPNNPK